MLCWDPATGALDPDIRLSNRDYALSGFRKHSIHTTCSGTRVFHRTTKKLSRMSRHKMPAVVEIGARVRVRSGAGCVPSLPD